MSATLLLELRVPDQQAEAFLKAMTGNDDDVLLAAETAMRDRISDDESDEAVELSFEDEAEAKAALRSVR